MKTNEVFNSTPEQIDGEIPIDRSQRMNMKARKTVSLAVFTLSLLMLGIAARKESSSSNQTPAAMSDTGAIPITISSAVPSELNPGTGPGFGAPSASMQQAAAFAWQEFIALNWPAVPQTGALNTRDTPDNNCKFGDPKCTGPLVWETFRGKVEIFPGQGNPPGYTPTAPSYGYDGAPTYNYSPAILPCDAGPTQPVWINLDETDEITLASMYAGAAPSATSPANSAPQIVRFLAKGNRTEYAYVAQNQWWDSDSNTVKTVKNKTIAYLAANMVSPPAGGNQYVSLPDGTIETKAGWRLLTPTEASSGRFTTAMAQYYENGTGGTICSRQAVFGLVALHIIQKTPTAPYFIYASFEQTDNIQTPAGTPVEDEDGRIIPPQPPCRAGQAAPCPTTPSVDLQDTPITHPPFSVPPQVNLVPANSPYCTTAGTPADKRLYYHNTNSLSQMKRGLPRAGFICVNYRDNPIPDAIISANQTAHAAIKAYNRTQNIPDSPWLYYKLLNVQYQVIDKDYAGLYTGMDPNSGHDPSSYHLANIVVETNRTLQLFSGGLVSGGGTGVNSDYDSQFSGPPGSAIHRNMYYNHGQANMGGCMGCHGSQGQHQGGDFSVIFAVGRVAMPEPPTPATLGVTAAIVRNRKLAVARSSFVK
jgi:hypothetical protein